MQENDKKKIIERYEARLKDFGPVQKSLGLLKGRQRFSFHYLEQIRGFSDSDSVLDLGCGYGDLYNHLRQAGWKGEYIGVDIVPGLISEAKKRYKEARFELMDIVADNFTQQCDWVFSSGVLTSKTQDLDSYEHVREMLSKMYSLSKKGVSVNFCSPLVDFESEINFHPDFGKLLKIIAGLSNRFTLRHDYMPYEFAVYIYKDNQINKEVNIFSSEQYLYDKLKVVD